MSQYQIILGQVFCVTVHNRICSVMDRVEKDDVVAPFQGADRLFILRLVGRRYRHIGDAYVDGLMKGEAYKSLDPDNED